MDLNTVISQLRHEAEQLDEAIRALERVEASQLQNDIRSRSNVEALPKTAKASAGA